MKDEDCVTFSQRLQNSKGKMYRAPLGLARSVRLEVHQPLRAAVGSSLEPCHRELAGTPRDPFLLRGAFIVLQAFVLR